MRDFMDRLTHKWLMQRRGVVTLLMSTLMAVVAIYFVGLVPDQERSSKQAEGYGTNVSFVKRHEFYPLRGDVPLFQKGW